MAIIDDKVLKPIRDAAKANQERRVAQATIKKEYNKELKKKTDDIINKKTQLDFSLVPSGLEDMIQEYAIENKDDYAKAAAIVAKLEGDSGNDLYKAAVTLMNRIDKGMLKMKNTIDAINTTQKAAFDRSKANTNALSMTDDEEMNFHNILQGNYNTLQGSYDTLQNKYDAMGKNYTQLQTDVAQAAKDALKIKYTGSTGVRNPSAMGIQAAQGTPFRGSGLAGTAALARPNKGLKIKTLNV